MADRPADVILEIRLHENRQLDVWQTAGWTAAEFAVILREFADRFDSGIDVVVVR